VFPRAWPRHRRSLASGDSPSTLRLRPAPCRVKRATTYAAINQTLFVFAKVMKGVSPYDAADFLEDLQKNAPAGVSSVITSDHEAFGHPAEQPWEPKFPQRIHPFIKACRASHIGRTVEKSSNSTRMMMMKGWPDVVLKLREARRPRRSVIGLRGDFDAQTIRSIAEELKDRPRERLLAVAAIFDGVTRVEAAMNADVTNRSRSIMPRLVPYEHRPVTGGV
jgi:hypothetical protein